MNNNPFSRENTQGIETLQDFYSEILEYYDELFPFSKPAMDCISRFQHAHRASYQANAAPLFRYLGVGCATGTLENQLSSPDIDITGIDKNPDMIATSQRRIKRSFSNIRFFEMSAIDIGRFLKKKGSFQLIGCLENTLPYFSDETLTRKFFHDARQLLGPGGTLLIQTLNFDAIEAGKPYVLPSKSSVRVQLDQRLAPAENNKFFLEMELELGNGRVLALQKGTQLLASTREQVTSWATEAGFTECSFFADLKQTPWKVDSPETIAVCC